MAEWLVEQGIGETRAVRLEGGEIAQARVAWPDELAAGAVVEARLVARSRGSARGTAELADGTHVLVDRLPATTSQGAALQLSIVRPALAEGGRGKLARARPTDQPARPAPPLGESLAGEGHQVREVARFPEGDWNALMAEAFAREVAFAGGALLFSPTPAMTLVDIDGDAAPAALALAACAPLAAALRRFDIGGSIGIDFPTLPDKAQRSAVDAALAHALGAPPSPWQHERTAMNGFGFVQLVARLERPSLLHRATLHRAATAARLLLRRAEALEGAGIIELATHPELEQHLRAEWLAELRRRTGRETRFRFDRALAIEAPQAQFVPR